MSGFEIAGVVLGAFPIAILALESYRDVARRLGFWFEIRREYQKCDKELRFHRLSYELNLKQLLLPLVADDELANRLMKEPGGEAWAIPAIADALEQRLTESYELYMGIIDEMERVMDELNNELALDIEQVRARLEHSAKSNKGNNSAVAKLKQLALDKKSREYHLYRIKFSLGESVRRRLFGELQSYNMQLEKLLAAGDVVSNLRAERAAVKKGAAASAVDAALCGFWNHADRLYKALLDAWGCTCRDQHCARLMLQHRARPEREFRLVVSSNRDSSDAVGSHHWVGCRIKIKESESGQTRADDLAKIELIAPDALPKSLPQHRTAQPGRPSMLNRDRRKPPVKEKSVQTATKSSVSLMLAPPKILISSDGQEDGQEDSYGQIVNLCSQLAVAKSASSQCTGYLEHSGRRYYLYPEEILSTTGEVHTGLAQMLAKDSPAPFTRRQRHYVAMVLASSFVQLKETPWISALKKSNIEFPLESTGDMDAASVHLDRPSVRQLFGPSAIARKQPVGLDTEALGNLGIVLLELCFGKPIEDHHSRQKFPADNDNDSLMAAFDVLAALEWLKEVNDEAGADYADAVEWCLAGCRKLSSNALWRREMLDQVVAPLMRSHAYLERRI